MRSTDLGQCLLPVSLRLLLDDALSRPFVLDFASNVPTVLPMMIGAIDASSGPKRPLYRTMGSGGEVGVSDDGWSLYCGKVKVICAK